MFEKIKQSILKKGKEHRMLLPVFILALFVLFSSRAIINAPAAMQRKVKYAAGHIYNNTPLARRFAKRFVAGLMAFSMMFSMSGVFAFAADNGASALPALAVSEPAAEPNAEPAAEPDAPASEIEATAPAEQPAQSGEQGELPGLEDEAEAPPLNDDATMADCVCPIQDSGEAAHLESCPLYQAPLPPVEPQVPVEPQQKCVCTAICAEGLTNAECTVCVQGKESCAYTAPLTAEAVTAVYALIEALPTMDELALVDTEGEGFAEYLAKLRLDTAAARAAYDALTEEDKASFAPAVLEKLTALEEALAAMPVNMMVKAAPVTTWAALKAAILAAPENGTETVINFTGTIASSDTHELIIDSGRNIVIDGGKIEGAGEDLFLVQLDSKLTLRNFHVDGQYQLAEKGVIINNYGGTLTIDEGCVFENINLPNKSGDSGIIFSRATCTVAGGVFRNNTSINTQAYGFNSVAIYNSGTLKITGGTFSNNKHNGTGLGAAVCNNSSAKCYISGGTFDSSNVAESNNAGIYHDTQPNVTGEMHLSGSPAINCPLFFNARLSSKFIYLDSALTDNVTLKPAKYEEGYVLVKAAAGYTLTNDDYLNIKLLQPTSGTWYTKLSADSQSIVATEAVGDRLAKVYLAPVNGNDTNNGKTAATAIKTFDKAKQLLANGGTIILVPPVAISGNELWELPGGPFGGATVTDGGTTTITVVNGGSLNLGDITIDGIDRIEVESGGSATIGDATVIKPETGGKTDIVVQSGGTLEIGKDTAFTNIDKIYTTGGGTVNNNGNTAADGKTDSTTTPPEVTDTPPAVECTCIAPDTYHMFEDIAREAENYPNLWNFPSKGVAVGGSCAVTDHKTNKITYTYSFVSSVGNSTATVSSHATTPDTTVLSFPAADVYTMQCVSSANGKETIATAEFTITSPVPVPAKITIKINDTETEYGGASLKAAVDAAKGASGSYADITKLTITAGEMTADDWTWFKGDTTNTPVLSKLTHFTIDAGISDGKVAPIPSGADLGNKVCNIFPKTITNVIIPQEITVGANAFKDCISLTTVSLPKASSIGKYAFTNCWELTTVSLPKATSISDYAFQNCKKLVDVELLKATRIGTNAFQYCALLTTLSLPAVTSIEDNAFQNCTSLTVVSLSAARSIGNSAFKGCTSLATASFPMAISIGNFAFQGCTMLATASFPIASSIGISAFSGCTQLATLKLGAVVPREVGSDAFNQLPSPRSLVLVNTDGLTELKGDSLTTAQVAYDKVSDGITDSTEIDGLWYGWKVREPIVESKITIKINDTETEYGGASLQAAVDAAKGASGSYADITKLTITAGEVTTPDWKWFEASDTPGDNAARTPVLTALTDFTISEEVISVADIPDNVRTFFPVSIVNVSIPHEIAVRRFTFKGCSALKNASIPNATAIEYDAFEKCTSLTSANFPKATTIGYGAFEDCTSLTSANFAKAELMANMAFYGCSKLASLTLGATPPETTAVRAEFLFSKFHPSPLTLTLVGEDGITKLTGDALTAAQILYDAADVKDENNGSNDDGHWYYWPVRVVEIPLDDTITFLRNRTYTIANAAQLDNLSKLVNSPSTPGEVIGYTIKLINDITASDSFAPIGLANCKFQGTFDGNSHVVTINTTVGKELHGLFNYVGDKGTVKNLGVDGNVNNSIGYAGGVVSDNYGIVQNCYNKGTITAGKSVGGVVSENFGKVLNCYNTGTISGIGTDFSRSNTGGVVGKNYYQVIGCYNTGKISGNATVGGVVGLNIQSVNISETEKFKVENCYNTGEVSNIGNDHSCTTGGIVGYSKQGQLIQNCYNTGKVSSNKGPIGGIAGKALHSVVWCYNIGEVSALDNIGGIVGVFGDQYNSWLTACVSLGSSLSRNSETVYKYVNRLTGYNDNGNLASNKARSDMLVQGKTVSGTATNLNGADVAVGEETLQSVVFSGWGDVWEIPAGGKLVVGAALPTLKGMGLQNPTLPKAEKAGLFGTVTISGVLEFGETLTANLSGDNNTGILTYQWKRGDTNIGTGATYTTVADDIRCILTCVVTSSEQAGTLSASTTTSISKANVSKLDSITFAFDGDNPNKLMNTTTAMEYSLNGGTDYTLCAATSTDLTSFLSNITATKDIIIRVKETPTHNASGAQIIDITIGALVANVVATDCASYENNDGKLSGVTTAMEYKPSTSSEWINGTGSEITGLTSGTYEVRVKAQGVALAGNIVRFTIAEKVDTPMDSNVIRLESGKTYTVADANQLDRLSYLVRSNGGYTTNYTVKLLNSITANTSFVAINQFSGTFDGCGHMVTLAINSTTSPYQGLFGIVTVNGTVKNVGVGGSVTGSNVGGVATVNRGTVQNCYNTATLLAKGSDRYAGGVVGQNYGKVLNCYNTGTVSCNNTGTDSVMFSSGGIVGINEGTVKNCVSLGASIIATGPKSNSFGRVVGKNSGAVTLAGNKARSDMLVQGKTVSGTATNLNGADVAVGEETLQSVVFSGWGNEWEIPADGKLVVGSALPTLKGFAEQQKPTLPEAETVAETKITIKINGTETEYSGASLQEAVSKSDKAAGSITALKITAGEVTDADWKWLHSLTKLTDFEVAAGIEDNKVAPIPNGTDDIPIFPESIVKAIIPQAIAVGEYAFAYCEALTTVELPKATQIGGYAFVLCKALKSVSLPKATSIGKIAFQACNALTTLELPEVTSIKELAFSSCEALASVSLPKVTSIGDYAFRNCPLLTTLKLTATPPTTMGDNVFDGCHPDRSLVLVNAIGSALTGSTLTTAQNAYKAAADGNSADDLWYGWKVGEPIATLKITIEVSGGKKAEGTSLSDAVSKCGSVSGINALKITAGTVTADDWMALKDELPMLKTFEIDASVSVVDIPNSSAFKSASITAPIFPYTITSVIVPQEIKVGDCAFLRCTRLTNVEMLNVTAIGDSAFENCTNLTQISLPKAKVIGEKAFYGCESLSTASMPNAINIGKFAFIGCKSLTSMKLPQAPPQVGEGAFSYYDKEQTAVIVDAQGKALEGMALAEAVAAYKAVDDSSMNGEAMGNDTWYKWKLPIVSEQVAVTGVSLNKPTLTLEAGKNETLVATLAPANATNKEVTWKSSNTNVATVDQNGKVTAISVGSATITVTTTDGGKTAICAVTVTKAVIKPAPGGVIEAPLTQDMVDDVFGENNATLNNTTSPPTITIENSVTTENPIEIETDVTIDLNGNTITGKPGQPPITVGDGDKVTIDGNGTISGGNNSSGTAGNGITGGTGGNITIGGGVTVEGGDGTSGGNGIQSGGNVNVDGIVNGGNGTAGNGGDGVDVSGGAENVIINSGGSANGGDSTGGNGNGGNGITAGTGDITINGGGSASGGNGNGSGTGGNGAMSNANGDITNSGTSTGGNGGNNGGSGGGGNGGNGTSTNAGNTTITGGGSSTGGNGGSGTTGGNGGNGANSGTIIVENGGSASGGSGGSGTQAGGNGGSGSSSSGKGEIDGCVSGGSGGDGGTTGGNGGSGAASGSGSNAGDIVIGGSASGGIGGNGGTTGGSGGDGTTTGGDISLSGSSSSSSGGNGGNGTTSGANGGNGGNGTTSGGSTTVSDSATATGGNGGTGSTSGGNGGNGGNGASSGNTIVNGGAIGGNGGNASTNGDGGNGGNGVDQGSGTVNGSGTATGGNGGQGAGTGSGGSGGNGVGGGAATGDDLVIRNGISESVEVVGNANTEVSLLNPAQTVAAVLTEEEKNDTEITDVKVTLKVDDKTAAKPDQAAVESKKPANSVIGAFFDITLQKTITKSNSTGSPETVTTVTEVPNGAITITIEIPVGMRDGVKNSYVVIRVHNGISEALETKQTGNELSFETNKFSTYAIAYTKSKTPEPTPNPNPNPNPNPAPAPSNTSPSASTSGGNSSSDKGNKKDIWVTAIDKIQKADSGDVIKVNANGYDNMPHSVMNALSKQDNVSLEITWNGIAITIPADKAQNDEPALGYWPISLLAELFADIQQENLPDSRESSQSNSVSTPTNENSSPDSRSESEAFVEATDTPQGENGFPAKFLLIVVVILSAGAIIFILLVWKRRKESNEQEHTKK